MHRLGFHPFDQIFVNVDAVLYVRMVSGTREGLSESIGSVGDAYDNAAAGTVMGLFKK